jgi:predicted extracellular nuclease
MELRTPQHPLGWLCRALLASSIISEYALTEPRCLLIPVRRFGFFCLLPLTAPTVQSQLAYDPAPSPYTAATDPCSIIIGDYNVENMGPDVPHLPKIAAHIVEYLKTPDLIFLQEIQDDSGKVNDGTVSANVTLQSLVDAINAAGATFEYAFVDIPPVDGQDGGMPGGNIRTAYLYNPHKISLVPGSPHGGSMDSTKVVIDSAGELGLEYNPGRLDPSNAAWNMSRKPLVANWQTISGERFFTINVHYSSKSGSSPVHGDARPPVNGAVAARTSQVNVTAAFAKTLLDLDPDASLVIAGDMNEHVHARSVFAPFDGLVQDLDVLAGIPPEERYTYVYEQNMQEIDHLFVSPAIAARGPALEHVHVNTWAPSEGERASDHDPSWAQVKVCTNLQRFAGARECTFRGKFDFG